MSRPQNLSELVLSEILSGKVNSYTDLVDKLKVREYFAQFGLSRYLPEIYGRWANVEAIDWENLPNRFVLKTNHGSGNHVICWDKAAMKKEDALRQLEFEYDSRLGPMEPQYAGIERMCYAEELIEDTRGGGRPIDYKFMTSGGEVRAILVCAERDKGTKLALFSPTWEQLPGIKPHKLSQREYLPPPKLEEMLQVAQSIAKRFTQVRVDMYCLPDGRVLLGELTFTPEGGYMRYFTTSALRDLGLPEGIE
ncbi:ATP-grasp fold amidoligase family protein [Ornithinimicrobium flavum]|uniref:ATP-grasp fold amidoligase family protein n=1 Tax=Ornithinimicrobium flavum TaxID=1288636 RepID=UPI00130518F2|nr:ATP-grasp fold amidoligase family protein [Ornithinimicrobium flavum]